MMKSIVQKDLAGHTKSFAGHGLSSSDLRAWWVFQGESSVTTTEFLFNCFAVKFIGFSFTVLIVVYAVCLYFDWIIQ